MTSGVNAVPLAFAVNVIELTVAPTLAESCTSIVMATENANDDPESPGHCGLQRVAVIGLGRTPTLKLAWLELPELTWDGEVELLLHAIDAASEAAVTPARRNLVTCPPGACAKWMPAPIV
jgi:hypothetical protein